MAITVAHKDNINQMDIRKGGIYSEKARVEVRHNPMLVIGLGGTGIDAMLRLKNLIGRRFDMPVGENGKRLESPGNIRFLGFETNLDEIKNKEYNGTKLDVNSEYQNLTEPGLNEILQSPDTKIPDYIRDWLDNPVRLRSRVKGGTTGANGVRQGGRLLLSLKLNDIVSNLTNVIVDLLGGTDSSEKLEVFVLTGVSGGTGSGTFIDVPYIIRGLMESGNIVASGSDRLDIISYIFTPDVLISRVTDTSYHNVLMINGYAALKELDYLMNIEQRGERFIQRYGPNLTVNTTKPPFSLCHLISATGTTGFKPNVPYDYCMNIAAEHIVNFMSNMVDDKGNIFGVHAYRANIDTAIGSMMTNLRPKYSANFIYNVLGASAFELPQIDIMTYLAHKLFLKMKKLYNNIPSEKDVNEYLNLMQLTLEQTEAVFEEGNPYPIPLQNAENKPQFGDDNILKNEERLSVDATSWANDTTAEYEKKYLNLKTVKVADIEKDYINRVFKDPEKGPFYAQLLLYNIGNFNILNSLTAYKNAAEKKYRDYPKYIENAEVEIGEKRTIFKKALLGKSQKRLEFINAYRKLARLNAERKRSEYIIKLYDDLYHGLLDLNNKVYTTFAEVLKYLTELFETNGKILTELEFDTIGNVDTYTWKLFDIKNNSIMTMLDKVSDEVDIDKCITMITSKMLNESERWLKEGNIDIASFCNEFINEQFADIATKTMDEYLFTLFKDTTTVKQHVQKTVIPDLAKHATPMFPISAEAKLATPPSWKMIVLPESSESVIQAFTDVARMGLHGLKTQHILKSNISSRIYWLNLEVGIPMCWHSGLYSYEEKYTRVITSNDELSIGCHLYQSEKKDWRRLPSPVSDLSWDSSYTNRYISDSNSKKRDMFQKGIQYGIIRIVDLVCNIYCADNIKLDEIKAIPDPQNAVQAKSSKALLLSYKEQWSDDSKTTKAQVFASVLEGDDLTKGYRESFVRCFDLWDKTEAEITKYELIMQKLEICEKTIAQSQARDKTINLLVNALFTGVIKKESGLYKYANEENEQALTLLNTAKIKEPSDAMFPEYALFKEFEALDTKKLNSIVNKSDKRLDLVNEGMMQTAKKLYDLYKNQKIKFDDDEDEIINDDLRADMYQFYFKAMNMLDAKSKMLDD